MLLDLILWIAFGALVGWVASIIMRTNEEQGAVANVIVGIVGALLGGAIAKALGQDGVTGFNLESIFTAIIGAVVLLFFIRMFSGTRSRV
jgi:uncharacterized membrane protein YeaQ/YmgE (transglycosylase-associated protein family)